MTHQVKSKANSEFVNKHTTILHARMVCVIASTTKKDHYMIYDKSAIFIEEK